MSGVGSAMRRHGLEIRPHLPPPPDELADEAWPRDQYMEQRRSIKTIARLLGVRYERVRLALIAAGLHTPRPRPEPEPEPVLDVPAHWRFLDEAVRQPPDARVAALRALPLTYIRPSSPTSRGSAFRDSPIDHQ